LAGSVVRDGAGLFHEPRVDAKEAKPMSEDERRRPGQDEYFEYYERYIGLVPNGDIVAALGAQRASSLDLYSAISEEKAAYRYAPGKWSIKEVLGHVVDIEWLFTYRALHFARGDDAALPGVDQDIWMAGADFPGRAMRDIVEEYCHVRSANIILFDSFHGKILDRKGSASGVDFTVRSIPYILAGHELHHVKVLQERYL
jgi:hypothetical protein